jgi:hypothetical protein
LTVSYSKAGSAWLVLHLHKQSRPRPVRPPGCLSHLTGCISVAPHPPAPVAPHRFGIQGLDVYLGPYTPEKPDGTPWNATTFPQLIPSTLLSSINPEGPILLPEPVRPSLTNLGRPGLPSVFDGGSDGGIGDAPPSQKPSQGSPGIGYGGGGADASSGDNKSAMIAGIAAGAAAGPLLVALGVLVYIRYQRKHNGNLHFYSKRRSSGLSSGSFTLLNWLASKVRWIQIIPKT